VTIPLTGFSAAKPISKKLKPTSPIVRPFSVTLLENSLLLEI
jgi:hypothetical protein